MLEIKQDENNSDYFWKGLDTNWKNKLLTNRFLIKVKISKGDNEKNSIIDALNDIGINVNLNSVSKFFKKYITNIPNWQFSELLDSYKQDVKHGRFTGKWNPNSIRNKNDFKKLINFSDLGNTNFDYADSDTTISILIKLIGYNIYILKQDYQIKQHINNNNDEFVILYEHPDIEHSYMACGMLLKDNKHIKTQFDNETNNRRLNMIKNKDEMIKQHIYKTMEDTNPTDIKLIHVLKQVKTNLQENFDDVLRKQVIKIFSDILKEKLENLSN